MKNKSDHIERPQKSTEENKKFNEKLKRLKRLKFESLQDFIQNLEKLN